MKVENNFDYERLRKDLEDFFDVSLFGKSENAKETEWSYMLQIMKPLLLYGVIVFLLLISVLFYNITMCLIMSVVGLLAWIFCGVRPSILNQKNKAKLTAMLDKAVTQQDFINVIKFAENTWTYSHKNKLKSFKRPDLGLIRHLLEFADIHENNKILHINDNTCDVEYELPDGSVDNFHYPANRIINTNIKEPVLQLTNYDIQLLLPYNKESD